MQLLIASQNPGKVREFRQLLADLPELEVLSAADLPATKDLNPPETGQTFAQNAAQKARAFARAAHLPVLADDSGLCVSALGDFPGVYSARWLKGSDRDRAAGILALLNYFLDSPEQPSAPLSSSSPSSPPSPPPLPSLHHPLPPATAPASPTFIDLDSWSAAITAQATRHLAPHLGRAAFYAISLCYFDPDTDQEYFFSGHCRGHLGLTLSGSAGFGYDPLFIPDLSLLPDQQLAQQLQGQSFGELPPAIKAQISHRAQALAQFRDFLTHPSNSPR